MSFSGFSDVEINQYEVPLRKKKSLGPKISSTSHKSVKHVPLKAEIEDEEDEEHSIDKLRFARNAVKQRKEKSNLEAEKLKEIQVELAKLDEIVGSDVKIIRKDIEGVTQHLSEARKRFERVEKEYVKAKLDLHRHEERKK
ncbi:GORAB [Lepeophtheirus salmonis]|uniref:RAB6-interacting golgin n=1 Tax=Lepeophtheirus salmonis TaxID=72036 RepID=A0A7R8CJQ6_LEPSM|nr:GORAB [Lepeophtheirus salmonis]CAF2813248.1 GORAB [Lepeophtheirus salmonis]